MHSLGIVQWNFTRRDHPGNPGRVSGSGPVIPFSLKMKNAQPLPTARFCISNEEDDTIAFFVLFINNSFNSTYVPFFLDFDTWHNLDYSFHSLTTHATCVT